MKLLRKSGFSSILILVFGLLFTVTAVSVSYKTSQKIKKERKGEIFQQSQYDECNQGEKKCQGSAVWNCHYRSGVWQFEYGYHCSCGCSQGRCKSCPSSPSPSPSPSPSSCSCINGYWQGSACDSWMRGSSCGSLSSPSPSPSPSPRNFGRGLWGVSHPSPSPSPLDSNRVPGKASYAQSSESPRYRVYLPHIANGNLNSPSPSPYHSLYSHKRALRGIQEEEEMSGYKGVRSRSANNPVAGAPVINSQTANSPTKPNQPVGQSTGNLGFDQKSCTAYCQKSKRTEGGGIVTGQYNPDKAEKKGEGDIFGCECVPKKGHWKEGTGYTVVVYDESKDPPENQIIGQCLETGEDRVLSSCVYKVCQGGKWRNIEQRCTANGRSYQGQTGVSGDCSQEGQAKSCGTTITVSSPVEGGGQIKLPDGAKCSPDGNYALGISYQGFGAPRGVYRAEIAMAGEPAKKKCPPGTVCAQYNNSAYCLSQKDFFGENPSYSLKKGFHCSSDNFSILSRRSDMNMNINCASDEVCQKYGGYVSCQKISPEILTEAGYYNADEYECKDKSLFSKTNHHRDGQKIKDCAECNVKGNKIYCPPLNLARNQTSLFTCQDGDKTVNQGGTRRRKVQKSAIKGDFSYINEYCVCNEQGQCAWQSWNSTHDVSVGCGTHAAGDVYFDGRGCVICVGDNQESILASYLQINQAKKQALIDPLAVGIDPRCGHFVADKGKKYSCGNHNGGSVYCEGSTCKVCQVDASGKTSEETIGSYDWERDRCPSQCAPVGGADSKSNLFCQDNAVYESVNSGGAGIFIENKNFVKYCPLGCFQGKCLEGCRAPDGSMKKPGSSIKGVYGCGSQICQRDGSWKMKLNDDCREDTRRRIREAKDGKAFYQYQNLKQIVLSRAAQQGYNQNYNDLDRTHQNNLWERTNGYMTEYLAGDYMSDGLKNLLASGEGSSFDEIDGLTSLRTGHSDVLVPGSSDYEEMMTACEKKDPDFIKFAKPALPQYGMALEGEHQKNMCQIIIRKLRERYLTGQAETGEEKFGRLLTGFVSFGALSEYGSQYTPYYQHQKGVEAVEQCNQAAQMNGYNWNLSISDNPDSWSQNQRDCVAAAAAGQRKVIDSIGGQNKTTFKLADGSQITRMSLTERPYQMENLNIFTSDVFGGENIFRSWRENIQVNTKRGAASRQAVWNAALMVGTTVATAGLGSAAGGAEAAAEMAEGARAVQLASRAKTFSLIAKAVGGNWFEGKAGLGLINYGVADLVGDAVIAQSATQQMGRGELSAAETILSLSRQAPSNQVLASVGQQTMAQAQASQAFANSDAFWKNYWNNFRLSLAFGSAFNISSQLKMMSKAVNNVEIGGRVLATQIDGAASLSKLAGEEVDGLSVSRVVSGEAGDEIHLRVNNEVTIQVPKYDKYGRLIDFKERLLSPGEEIVIKGANSDNPVLRINNQEIEVQPQDLKAIYVVNKAHPEQIRLAENLEESRQQMKPKDFNKMISQARREMQASQASLEREEVVVSKLAETIFPPDSFLSKAKTKANALLNRIKSFGGGEQEAPNLAQSAETTSKKTSLLEKLFGLGKASEEIPPGEEFKIGDLLVKGGEEGKPLYILSPDGKFQYVRGSYKKVRTVLSKLEPHQVARVGDQIYLKVDDGTLLEISAKPETYIFSSEAKVRVKGREIAFGEGKMSVAKIKAELNHQNISQGIVEIGTGKYFWNGAGLIEIPLIKNQPSLSKGIAKKFAGIKNFLFGNSQTQTHSVVSRGKYNPFNPDFRANLGEARNGIASRLKKAVERVGDWLAKIRGKGKSQVAQAPEAQNLSGYFNELKGLENNEILVEIRRKLEKDPELVAKIEETLRKKYINNSQYGPGTAKGNLPFPDISFEEAVMRISEVDEVTREVVKKLNSGESVENILNGLISKLRKEGVVIDFVDAEGEFKAWCLGPKQMQVEESLSSEEKLLAIVHENVHRQYYIDKDRSFDINRKSLYSRIQISDEDAAYSAQARVALALYDKNPKLAENMIEKAFKYYNFISYGDILGVRPKNFSFLPWYKRGKFNPLNPYFRKLNVQVDTAANLNYVLPKGDLFRLSLLMPDDQAQVTAIKGMFLESLGNYYIDRSAAKQGRLIIEGIIPKELDTFKIKGFDQGTFVQASLNGRIRQIVGHNNVVFESIPSDSPHWHLLLSDETFINPRNLDLIRENGIRTKDVAGGYKILPKEISLFRRGRYNPFNPDFRANLGEAWKGKKFLGNFVDSDGKLNLPWKKGVNQIAQAPGQIRPPRKGIIKRGISAIFGNSQTNESGIIKKLFNKIVVEPHKNKIALKQAQQLIDDSLNFDSVLGSKLFQKARTALLYEGDLDIEALKKELQQNISQEALRLNNSRVELLIGQRTKEMTEIIVERTKIKILQEVEEPLNNVIRDFANELNTHLNSKINEIIAGAQDAKEARMLVVNEINDWFSEKSGVGKHLDVFTGRAGEIIEGKKIYGNDMNNFILAKYKEALSKLHDDFWHKYSQAISETTTEKQVPVSSNFLMTKKYVFSDPHADGPQVERLIEQQGLIKVNTRNEIGNGRWTWTGGEQKIQVLGDYLDRPPEELLRESKTPGLDLFKELLLLREQARAQGGDIELQLGNHEILNRLAMIVDEGSRTWNQLIDPEIAAVNPNTPRALRENPNLLAELNKLKAVVVKNSSDNLIYLHSDATKYLVYAFIDVPEIYEQNLKQYLDSDYTLNLDDIKYLHELIKYKGWDAQALAEHINRNIRRIMEEGEFTSLYQLAQNLTERDGFKNREVTVAFMNCFDFEDKAKPKRIIHGHNYDASPEYHPYLNSSDRMPDLEKGFMVYCLDNEMSGSYSHDFNRGVVGEIPTRKLNQEPPPGTVSQQIPKVEFHYFLESPSSGIEIPVSHSLNLDLEVKYAHGGPVAMHGKSNPAFMIREGIGVVQRIMKQPVGYNPDTFLGRLWKAADDTINDPFIFFKKLFRKGESPVSKKQSLLLETTDRITEILRQEEPDEAKVKQLREELTGQITDYQEEIKTLRKKGQTDLANRRESELLAHLTNPEQMAPYSEGMARQLGPFNRYLENPAVWSETKHNLAKIQTNLDSTLTLQIERLTRAADQYLKDCQGDLLLNQSVAEEVIRQHTLPLLELYGQYLSLKKIDPEAAAKYLANLQNATNLNASNLQHIAESTQIIRTIGEKMEWPDSKIKVLLVAEAYHDITKTADIMTSLDKSLGGRALSYSELWDHPQDSSRWLAERIAKGGNWEETFGLNENELRRAIHIIDSHWNELGFAKLYSNRSYFPIPITEEAMIFSIIDNLSHSNPSGLKKIVGSRIINGFDKTLSLSLISNLETSYDTLTIALNYSLMNPDLEPLVKLTRKEIENFTGFLNWLEKEKPEFYQEFNQQRPSDLDKVFALRDDFYQSLDEFQNLSSEKKGQYNISRDDLSDREFLDYLNNIRHQIMNNIPSELKTNIPYDTPIINPLRAGLKSYSRPSFFQRIRRGLLLFFSHFKI